MKPENDRDMLLNEVDAAKLLGLTQRTLQAWRFYGKGPLFVRISKRCVRYRRSDLVAWIEKRIARSTSEITEAEKEDR